MTLEWLSREGERKKRVFKWFCNHGRHGRCAAVFDNYGVEVYLYLQKIGYFCFNDDDAVMLMMIVMMMLIYDVVPSTKFMVSQR